jgi:hypothetical protein
MSKRSKIKLLSNSASNKSMLDPIGLVINFRFSNQIAVTLNQLSVPKSSEMDVMFEYDSIQT